MEERKNLIALFSQETIFVLRRRRRTERGRKRDGRTDGWLTLVVRRPLRPHNVRYVARRGGGGSGDGTSRKRRVSGEGAGGKQCGGEEEGRRDGGRGAGGREGALSGHGAVAGAGAATASLEKSVCLYKEKFTATP